MNKKFIISNWKNHPDSLAEAEQILDLVNEYLGPLEEKPFSLVFCPPFVFTEEVGKILRTSHLFHQSELGAQDISVNDEAAMTGDTSGMMLKQLGVRYVIIGHSERRWKLEESDEIVNKKLKAVLRNELVPIVCVGEKIRNGDFKDFLKEQVLNTFAGLSPDEVARCLIAYEPVWAISTTPGAHPDTPGSALESVELIQKALNSKFKIQNSKFLYGGSITSTNARDFLNNDELDGILIGGASVNKKEFIKILSIAAKF